MVYFKAAASYYACHEQGKKSSNSFSNNFLILLSLSSISSPIHYWQSTCSATESELGFGDSGGIKRDPWKEAGGEPAYMENIKRKCERTETGGNSVMQLPCKRVHWLYPRDSASERECPCPPALSMAKADRTTALEVALSLPTRYGQKQMQT